MGSFRFLLFLDSCCSAPHADLILKVLANIESACIYQRFYDMQKSELRSLSRFAEEFFLYAGFHKPVTFSLSA